MNDENCWTAFFSGLIIGFIVWMITMVAWDISCINKENEIRKLEQESIQRGYAEYVVDVKTKEVTFKWKEGNDTK